MQPAASTFKRPRLRTGWEVRVVSCTETVLLTESDDSFTLDGRLYALLLPYVDGDHSPAEIASALSHELSTLDVQYGLSQLAAHGYIIDAEHLGDRGLARRAVAEAKYPTVAVYGFGVDTQPLAQVFSEMKITISEDADFALVLVNDYLHEDLAKFNLKSVANRRTWMVAKPVGAVVWVGPMFQPDRTPCWSCLALRLRENQRQLLRCTPVMHAPVPSALDFVVSETLSYLAGLNTENRLATFDVDSLVSEQHVVLQRPDCPACSSVRVASASACNVAIQALAYDDADAEQALSVDELYAKYRHHVSRLTGIVHSVHPAWNDDESLFHIWIAEHNFSMRYVSGTELRWMRASRSVGKGETHQQARATALCESLERYSGVFRGDEPRIRASYTSMCESAVHPNACMQFSAKQFDARAEWNQHEANFNWVPMPFDESQEVDWTPVWSLTHQVVRYIPTAYLYYKYPVSGNHDFCRPDSNGNAAGATTAQAFLNGFFEVVERDSVALWWYNRIVRPRVVLECSEQPYVVRLKESYRKHGRELWVLDITSDFGIPVYVAVAHSLRDAPEYIFGFGAHFDGRRALSRAVTELNQFRRSPNPAFTPADSADLHFLLGDEQAPHKEIRYASPLCGGTAREQVDYCVDLAAQRGLETLVLDQTRTDVGLAVVKVIVPGMRSFWARFGPGRLYTVPTELHWLQTSLDESQLNQSHLNI